MSDDVQAALRDMARSIGALESTVKTMTSTWQQQEQSASSGRRELHQKVDALRADVSAKVDGMRNDMTLMGGQLATAIKDISEMKPVVEAVEVVKQRAVGASWVSIWLYRIAIIASGGAAWVVVKYLNISVALK
ncbi:DUF1515 domain-containing protein [Bradyrhizobium xenonodulans]|uniref:DUF1515 domain-containing protein n=1 Tax=Bradyrhizobium xenonodulans TaxID=2736875 RepID=A0ABY7MCI8_9BRAD|nr:DUF1515 domain-containing protein [Bradyrhizobium xenonodulans]WBL75586.1 DUF1515 domain-containing protein [Bradyrhizobium xenonodulans]